MSKVTDIGVIVGRFQTHELHDEHIRLINHVVTKHPKTVLFLGVSKALGTKKNPMDFPTRKEMILAHWPAITVLPISDCKTDARWSADLDYKIREVFPIGSVMLYGGRDSFVNHYMGSFETEELEPLVYVSATDMRRECGKQILADYRFRAGVVYSTQNRYTAVFPTVDVAILRFKQGIGYEVLLGRKPNEMGYRFIGGFADANDNSLEMAARREAFEETGLSIDNVRYLSSYRVDDWRYQNEADKIMTTFFVADYISGAPRPADDIREVLWVPVLSQIEYSSIDKRLESIREEEGLTGPELAPTRHKLEKMAQSYAGTSIEPEHSPLAVDLHTYVIQLILKERNERS